VSSRSLQSEKPTKQKTSAARTKQNYQTKQILNEQKSYFKKGIDGLFLSRHK
jgi:hypothetical protein